MDKQKQIEEMRKVIKTFAINQHCNKENIYKSHLIISDSKGISTALYNAGYRKIPDGAVVLEQEDYDNLVDRAEYAERELALLYKSKDKARKEITEGKA